MFLDSGRILFSASDLNSWLGCRHATFLNLKLLRGEARAEERDDPELALIQQKGFEHERRYLERLQQSGKDIALIDARANLAARVAETEMAMRRGAEIIYQATFLDAPWNGAADFLIRVAGRSRFGAYAYEPLDAKLARSPQSKHVLQLCVYAKVLAEAQGVPPEQIHLVLGDMTQESWPLTHFVHYATLAQRRLEGFAAAPPDSSVGEPCAWCSVCNWHRHCEAEWERVDHLSRVANITRAQIAKLRAHGVDTVRDLAQLPNGAVIRKLQHETLARLKQQARLQIHKQDTGADKHELLPLVPAKGFARLPKPDPGDLFFDMEGDPLFDGGLQYLFGFVYRDGKKTVFRTFWGHSREEEKRAFEQAIDFITARLRAHPDAHIYHYAHYEQTAFNSLSTLHGTREAELDDLLRKHRFVDLFRVVREAIRVSEPSYSIKNLETFYMRERDGDIAGGGDSIVVYERWRELQQPELLKQIAEYNETDCRSTLLLRNWLLTLRLKGTRWFAGEPEAQKSESSDKMKEAERARARMAARLSEGVSEAEKPFRELVAHMLEFHRREAKPQWWARFHRQEMSTEELIDDAECLGGLTRDPQQPPAKDKRSLIYTFHYPAQDFKLRIGDKPSRADTLGSVGTISDLNEDRRQVSLRIVATQPELPSAMSLIPGKPYDTSLQREAIYRYAETIASGTSKYPAITGLLRRLQPRIAGVHPGSRIIQGETTLDKAVAAICALKKGAVIVQGPPGTGKTYTASHAIVELLRQKKRVGVSSNSHNAILKLLEGVEDVARRRKVNFRGVKKCSEDDHELAGATFIENVRSPREVFEGEYRGNRLAGGRADFHGHFIGRRYAARH